MKNGIVSLITATVLLGAGASSAQEAKPGIAFSGYVDADFVTTFSPGGVSDPVHTTGLEIDLTTTLTFSPKLNAVIYTTMNDGIVPAQGAGRTWDDVNFDGVAFNWQHSPRTTVMVGDLIYGTGYFNYYGNKRSAVVVGEHAVRGAGFTYAGFTLTTGAANLGAVDTAGTPLRTEAWGTFAKYDFAFGKGLVLTPSAKVVLGVDGATPVNAGLSFDGKFGGLTLSADLAVDYYSADYDPGFAFLLEPLYASGDFSLASTIFYNKKGRSAADSLSPSTPTTTSAQDAGEGSLLAPKAFDDLLVYLEPGFTLSETYAVGLPLEYHDPDLDLSKNEFLFVAPTFYVYPGASVQWWLWAGVTVPTAGGADPSYSAGSEIIFKF
jgi:hypothetical protein